MKRKKIHNDDTMRFSAAVKQLSLLLGKSPEVIHRRLKEKFGYKSYGWLWKRKKEILDFVLEQIKKAEYNIYS